MAGIGPYFTGKIPTVLFFNFFTVTIKVEHVVVFNPGKGRRWDELG